MQCALPTPIVFFIFGVIVSDCQLPKFTEKRIKLHKIAYKVTKNLSAGMEEGVAEKGGRRKNWGKSAMAVGG